MIWETGKLPIQKNNPEKQTNSSDSQMRAHEGRERDGPRARFLPLPFMSCRSCGFVLEPQPQSTNSSDSLVSQILRGSRPLLDSDHALLSAEIVELEQLQSLYAAQLQEIRLCRCAVLKALENRKSIYAPIRRLPRDILIEIFHSVCDSWWQEANENLSLRQRRDSLDVSGPLWVLGRVCGLWRDALQSSPASWARKLVVQAPFSKYAPEILQTYLEHTGEHLLRLYVNCTEPTQGDIIISLLVQSCQRWQNLRINADKSYMPYFESISHFPALQTIDINFYNAHDIHSVGHVLGCPTAMASKSWRAWDPSHEVTAWDNPFFWLYRLSRRFTPFFPTTEPQKMSPLAPAFGRNGGAGGYSDTAHSPLY